MLSESTLFILVLAGILITLAVIFYKKYQYKKVMSQKFPSQFAQLLFNKLPIYRQLSKTLMTALQQQILHFLYTKKFIGCNGIVITDEIRVVIAAEACLLILNRPNTGYAGLKWIYVYPSVFVAKQAQMNTYGVVSNQKRYLLGESWQNGKVILAWDNVESGMADFSDGNNVVLHEFAHQLDQESGKANGAPLLYTKDSYRVWTQVFSQEFQALRNALNHGENTLIDRYAATDPAEFFAVVTEVFFERPQCLQKLHPELFALLLEYYRLDPRTWQQGSQESA